MDLVFSDIHADIKALNAIMDVATCSVFEEKYGKFSRIINLGDVLERGTHPKEVLEKLASLTQTYPVKSVMGNHDEAFLYNKKVSGSSLESLDAHFSLSENDLSFFKHNKDNSIGDQQFVDQKKGLICVHGGPIDPKKITPKDAGEESWLYQKTWQRLSEEDFEFFSYAGYHYKASSAFDEGKNLLDTFVILCGHQHIESILKQTNGKIDNIENTIKPKTERLSDFTITKKEIPIEKSSNYYVRLGLGGPEGYYGIGKGKPHFGILQDNPRLITLFSVEN